MHVTIHGTMDAAALTTTSTNRFFVSLTAPFGFKGSPSSYIFVGGGYYDGANYVSASVRVSAGTSTSGGTLWIGSVDGVDIPSSSDIDFSTSFTAEIN